MCRRLRHIFSHVHRTSDKAKRLKGNNFNMINFVSTQMLRHILSPSIIILSPTFTAHTVGSRLKKRKNEEKEKHTRRDDDDMMIIIIFIQTY